MASEIELLKNKKILQYPIGLASSDVDAYGDDVQYMLFKINTDEKSTKLREDSSLGTVQSSTRQGTGIRAGIQSKNTDPDLVLRFGEAAVNKEKFYDQKGMIRLDKVVVLPMPNDHNLKTSVFYRDVDQTMLTRGGDMLNAARAGGLASDLATMGKNATLSALVNLIKSDATNTDALLAEERLAINPKKEVMYQSFDFRSFQFTFQFAPKSLEESRMVNEIIETFRYYSLPEISPGKLFYIFPSEFEISFMKGQKENPNIPRVATTVLRSVNVNYSPNGVWATLPNGAPVALTMNLDFMELELIDRKRIYNPESIVTSGY